MKRIVCSVLLAALTFAGLSSVYQASADDRLEIPSRYLHLISDTPSKRLVKPSPPGRPGKFKTPGQSGVVGRLVENCTSVNVGCGPVNCKINNNGTICEGKVVPIVEGAPVGSACSATC